MENIQEQKSDEPVEKNQKAAAQIPLKVQVMSKAMWYKNPSLIISIIALCCSLTFSLNSIINQKQSKEEERESSTITSIKKSIEELVDEENKYLQISSNQFIDITTKNNAGMTYQAKMGYLTDKISIVLNNENMDKIEPNLLLSYGKFLKFNGKNEMAVKVFNKTIKKSTDTTTTSICYRYIANIYANQSYSKFDSIKSRIYRKKDVQLFSSYNGDERSSFLSRSYELWALDEYFLFKNKSNGNLLLDSAKLFIAQLPDFNPSKEITINRLNESYNYYNDILLPGNMAGEYYYSSSDGKKGNAYISVTPNGISINIDYLDNNKLQGKLRGTGNITDLNNLKFEEQSESFNNLSQQLIYSGGSLNLSAIKNSKLSGVLHEYGKDAVKCILEKKHKIKSV